MLELTLILFFLLTDGQLLYWCVLTVPSLCLIVFETPAWIYFFEVPFCSNFGGVILACMETSFYHNLLSDICSQHSHGMFLFFFSFFLIILIFQFDLHLYIVKLDTFSKLMSSLFGKFGVSLHLAGTLLRTGLWEG